MGNEPELALQLAVLPDEVAVNPSLALIARARKASTNLSEYLNDLLPLELLVAMAESGDADAQYLLGKRYLPETGDPDLSSDPNVAAYWLERAAKQNHPQAQFVYGGLHSLGVGVPQDEATLIDWWRRSADGGFAVAQYELGYLYFQGWGVPQDTAQGIAIMKQAAEAGDRSAPYALAHVFETGLGIAIDNEQAAYWYLVEADRGGKHAQHRLGQMYRDGLGVPQDSTQAGLWLRRAAQQDLTDAQLDLGLLYASDESKQQDNEEALFWLWLAEEKERRTYPRIYVALQACTEVANRLTSEQAARIAERVTSWLKHHSKKS